MNPHEIDCNTFKLFYSKNKTCIYIQVEKRERELLKFHLKSYSKHHKP
jgi:hypothetical protein